MLKKALIVYLSLTAIVISFVTPASVFGIIKNFYPRNSSGWTGSVKIGTGRDVIDGFIYAGKTYIFPQNYVFRGYAAFDITDLPGNACVSALRVDGYCFGASTNQHMLEIRRLMNFPNAANGWVLADEIMAGEIYSQSLDVMRTTGPQSFALGTKARLDLERAAQSTDIFWFAVGFTETNEDDPTGIWKGWFDKEPVLHVTYSVPIQTAPAVSIDVDSICTGDQFCISWNAIPGASSYEIQESGSQYWISAGSYTSKCYAKSTGGDYSFAVRAVNDCGIGPGSQSVSVKVIDRVGTPSQPVVVDPPCINSGYTISWDPLNGVDYYEIQEDNHGWFSVSNSTHHHFSPSTTGTYSYAVRGVNFCGPGNSASIDVEVLTTLTAPAAPRASIASFCPDQNVTIIWRPVIGATEYLLTDYIAGIEVYNGPDLEWSAPHPSGSYEYHLAVTNGCGWSDTSGPRSFDINQQVATPGAPVSDHDPAVVGELYTISWDSVVGATHYELWEDGTAMVFSGNDYDMPMTKNIAGDFTYSVRACDDCGCSDFGPELALSVGVPTEVEEIVAPDLPDNYALNQNYPNPFNPETRIEFSLKHAGHVELTVYNIIGKTMRTLVNDYLSAGHKAITWDGRDNSGQQVSSGIYLYRLTTDEYAATKKMTLIK